MTLRLALTDALLTLAERTLGPATRPQAASRAAPPCRPATPARAVLRGPAGPWGGRWR